MLWFVLSKSVELDTLCWSTFSDLLEAERGNNLEGGVNKFTEFRRELGEEETEWIPSTDGLFE